MLNTFRGNNFCNKQKVYHIDGPCSTSSNSPVVSPKKRKEKRKNPAPCSEKDGKNDNFPNSCKQAQENNIFQLWSMLTIALVC